MKIFYYYIFLCLFLCLFSFKIYATSYDIQISGNTYTDKQFVLSLLDDLPDQINNKDIDKILKKLNDSGYFENLLINFENNTLFIVFDEKIKITNVDFIGNKRFKDDQINEIINFKNFFEYYDVNNIDLYINELKNLYQSYGYNQIKINYEIINSNDLLNNEIIFEIYEGNITKINKIFFSGNISFDKDILLSNIKSSENNLFKFYSKRVNFKNYVTKNDIIRLKKFYIQNGFKNVDIQLKNEIDIDKNKINLHFYITENEKYLFNSTNINFTKIDLSNAISTELKDILLKNSKANVNDELIYNSNKLNEQKKLISEFLNSKGITFFKIDILEKILDDNSIDIIFDIISTKPNYVKFINIYGNYRTIDKVIRREIVFSEGDSFTEDQISKSVENLNRLGIFKSVKIDSNLIDNDNYNIIVKIEEKQTGEFQLGLSFGTFDGASFLTGLNETNIGGTGRNLDFTINTSSNNTAYRLNIVEPHIFSSDVNLNYGINYKLNDYSSSLSYKTNTFSTNTGINYFLIEDLRHKINFEYKLIDYIITNNSSVSDSIKNSSGQNSEINITNSISLNKLNSFYFPSSGYYLDITNTISPKTSSKSGMLKNSLLYKKYYDNFGNVFSIQTKVGNVYSFNNTEIINSKKYSLGGKWLRGFDIYGAGPRNSISSYVGGNNLIASKLELSRSLNKLSDNPIKLNIFTDLGKVWGNKNNPSFSKESIRASYGLGIKLYSPIGPIGLSWGFPLADEAYDIKRMFLFSIGNID